jgi:hypothetical protein
MAAGPDHVRWPGRTQSSEPEASTAPRVAPAFVAAFRSSSSIQWGTLTVRHGRACASRLFSDCGRRAIGLAVRQHRPYDPGGLVDHGNGDEPARLAANGRLGSRQPSSPRCEQRGFQRRLGLYPRHWPVGLCLQDRSRGRHLCRRGLPVAFAWRGTRRTRCRADWDPAWPQGTLLWPKHHRRCGFDCLQGAWGRIFGPNRGEEAA